MYNGFYLFKNVAPGTYSVVVKAANYYDHVQTVQVLGNQVNYANVDMNMVRSTPPVVLLHIPAPPALTDSVEVATDIVLNFNWDMDEDATRAAFSITHSVAGTITFEDSRRTLRFTPSVPLEKATDYEVKLDTMPAHPDTTQVHHLATPFILNFRTKNRNKLGLVLSSPQAGDSTIGIKPTFMLVFDKNISTRNPTTSNL